MNYITVFECININIFTIILTYIIAIILFVALVVWAILWYKHEAAKNDSSKIKKHFLKVAMVSGAIAIISSVFSIVKVSICKENLYDEYMAGNTLVTEGNVIMETITDEDEVERINKLVIDDIDFNTSSKYTYNYSDVHDLCISDGDYVRVTYVTYKNNNFVMKIEKIE